MLDRLRKIFQGRNHKEIMLCSILMITFVIYSILAFTSFWMGFYDVFWVKFGVTLLVGLLLIFYIKRDHISLIAIILFIILEIDTSLALLSPHLYSFITIYPFFIIWGFFFFFRLKTALWMTLIHFIYWALAVYMRYALVADHPMFQNNMVDINTFTTSLVVVLLGIFYHLSTEVTYKALENDQKQKETMLREIHHRIKNNLNMMASVMGLQILNLENGHTKDPKDILINSKLRIESIAMIHESLYHNDDIEYVDFINYTRNLTDLIINTYHKNIDVKIDSNVRRLNEKTMLHIGIIINELFTNSIKYAFSNNESKKNVMISLFKKHGNCIFKYHNRDNQKADIQKILNSKTLGIKLIKLTVKQLGGKLDVQKKDGLVFTITFKA